MNLKLCRICLNVGATISLFDVHENLQYSTKIMKCVNVVIAEDDSLPCYICKNCVEELIVAYNFVLKCEASDKALRCINLTDDDQAQGVVDNKVVEIKTEQNCDAILELNTADGSPNKETLLKNKHVKKHNKNKRPETCVTCGFTGSYSAMVIHKRKHTGEKPYVCELCEASYSSKGGLKRHIHDRHHLERERKYTCESCGNSFYRKNDCINHIRIHTGERPYSCPFCSKKFSQLASLNRHKSIHSKEKPYSCQICHKRFADKLRVRRHLVVHSKEKKFACHFCGKSVKTKTALIVHMRIHSNVKNYVCNFCGTSFSAKGNLTAHIRRIHSEKSGQCSVCLKIFPDLKTHMVKHTGEKPFQCEYCKQSFSIKKSLRYHITFKHENRIKFKCSILNCSKKFRTALLLESHILKQHTNHTP